MHTVIIHTLGAAYVKKDIYFLAHDPEQILWLESEPDRLSDCVDEIKNHFRGKAVLEDYRLVILADLDRYPNSEYTDQKTKLQALLKIWFLKQLIAPLDALGMPPFSVATFFISTKNKDNATSEVLNYSQLFGFSSESSPEKLLLSYVGVNGERKDLDFTQYLGPIVHLSAQKNPPVSHSLDIDVSSGPDAPYLTDIRDDIGRAPEAEKKSTDHVERILLNGIKNCESYNLLRNAAKKLTITPIAFASPLPSAYAVFADVQINVAKLISLYQNGQDFDSTKIRPHNTQELTALLAAASKKLVAQRRKTGLQLYYPLDPKVDQETPAFEISAEIKKKLCKNGAKIPGVIETLDALDHAAAPADKSSADPVGQMRRKLHLGWLRLRSIKNEFLHLYAQLQEEYDPDKVYADQQAILDACTGGYTEWRAKQRTEDTFIVSDLPRSEPDRPQLSKAAYDEVIEARSGCAEGILERLEDFTDVREEAAVLHTKFREANRFWSPECTDSGAKKFRRFSFVMAVAFIVAMILPFFLISTQSVDYQISRAIAVIVTTAVFSFIYAFGVILWLNRLAQTLDELRFDLRTLIIRSGQLRADSIERVIYAYSNEFPLCLRKQLEYDRKVRIDAANEDATEKYELHMLAIEQALGEISDVRTALRLPETSSEGGSAMNLDYLLPPYAPVNAKFYMLFEGGLN